MTHNDVTGDGSNILVQMGGDVIIFDWEGSTLSVLGADIGLLTKLDEGDRLMSVYVEEMAEHPRMYRIALGPQRFRHG